MDPRLAAIYELSQRLMLLRDSQQIAEEVLEIAARVLAFQDSYFLLVEETTNELYVTAKRGQLESIQDLRLSLEGEAGVTVAAARLRNPVYVPDIRLDPRYVSTGFPALSELAVPVQIEGRVLGILNLESNQVDAFSAADQELLSILASQAALALENTRLYAQESRRLEELLTINQIATRINATLDLRQTLDSIVEAAADLIPCTLAEISLWDAGKQLLTLHALHSTPERRFPIGHSYPPGEGFTGWVVQNKQPLLVRDADLHPDIRADLTPGELPFKSYVGLPLLCCDELVGTLVLIHDRAGAFDQGDLRLLETLAGQTATAVRNARLYEDLSRHHQELSALYSVVEATSHHLDLHDLLEHALERIIKVTQAEGGAIRLLDTNTNQLNLVAQRGLSENYINQEKSVPIDQEIVGWVARTMQATLSEDMWSDERVSDTVRELLKEVGHRSLAQVPLRTKDCVVGTLGITAREPAFFNLNDLQLLEAIGHQLSTAITNAHLRQEALEAERLAAIGRVAASVAHDLRSPLGGIIRSAEFLTRPEISPETRQKLGRSTVLLAKRLVNTSQQILDYVRKESLPLRREKCTLSEFLADVLPVLEVDFSDLGIEVVRDFRYEGQILIDMNHMAQVIYNIATNARDAMPEGGKFTISTCKVNDQIQLRFSDTGHGVPEEYAERIFEPFFSYGKRQGAGLGLAIAQRIVEEHGGSIQLDRNAKIGACFVVYLPL